MSNTPDGKPERKFVIQLTEEMVGQVTLTEAEAREMFPDVPWDDPDASQAGHIDDQIQNGLEDDEFLCRLQSRTEQQDAALKCWEV